MRRLLASLLLCLSCGGLDNQPLTLGALHGRFPPVFDAASAWVRLAGRPDVATITPDGQFSFTQLEPGRVALIGMSNVDAGFRLELEVGARTNVDVSFPPVLETRAVEVELFSNFGRQDFSKATLDVNGLPLGVVKVEAEGEIYAGPFPLGCYDFVVTVPGFGAGTAQECLQAQGADAGVRQRFVVALPEPDGVTPGREGCKVSGCIERLRCESDGRCR